MLAVMNIDADLFKYWLIRFRQWRPEARSHVVVAFLLILPPKPGNRFSSPQSHRPLKYPSRHHGVKKKARVVANPLPFHIVLIGSCNESVRARDLKIRAMSIGG